MGFKLALRSVSACLATAFYSVKYPSFEVIGVDRVPKDGGVLICANHKKAEDAILLYKGLHKGQNRFTYFYGKAGLIKNKFCKWYLVDVLGMKTVSHSASDLGAVKWGLKKLKAGEVVCIFPEGTRNRTDKDLLDFQQGAAVIAHMAKTQVVTATISGNRKWFSKCSIEFSEPIDLSEFYSKRLDEDVKNGITEKIYKNVKKYLKK